MFVWKPMPCADNINKILLNSNSHICAYVNIGSIQIKRLIMWRTVNACWNSVLQSFLKIMWWLSVLRIHQLWPNDILYFYAGTRTASVWEYMETWADAVRAPRKKESQDQIWRIIFRIEESQIQIEVAHNLNCVKMSYASHIKRQMSFKVSYQDLRATF